MHSNIAAVPDVAMVPARKRRKTGVFNNDPPTETYNDVSPKGKIPKNSIVFCVWRDKRKHKCKVLDRKTTVTGDYAYYVHYSDFDRRMDEWVDQKRISVPQDTLLWDDDGHGDLDHDELKAHNERTKVKNIHSIVLGKFEMDTWYYSPFPKEHLRFPKLHFCEFCLNFFGHEEELMEHMRKCVLHHPPGNEIYRSKENGLEVAVFEVDGDKEIQYCQNLCYLAKLFLDHKTLQYDTEPFLFYVLCEYERDGAHLVGYFSKEKISTDGYNLACILTLPSYQRKGFGSFLISLSYELSKLENKTGTPERPLSDLGRKSYQKYWREVLLKLLLDDKHKTLSVKQLSDLTSFKTDDIIDTLHEVGILKYQKGEHVLSLNEKQLNERYPQKVRDPSKPYVNRCHAKKIHWVPYKVKERPRTRCGIIL